MTTETRIQIKLSTTFTLLRERGACKEGYEKLARHLGSVRKYGADTPIDLATILESNDAPDMLWCLRAVPDEQRPLARRFGSWVAADFAKNVLHIFEKWHPGDSRVRECIEAVYRYWKGEISLEELRKFRAAAYAASAAYAAAAAYAADAADAAYATSAAYAADAAADAAADRQKERDFQKTRLRAYFKGELSISLETTKP